MSNALAIASVTRILKDLLNDALVDGDASSNLGTDVTVTALPPDRIMDGNGTGEQTQLNLFLHQITPNAAWRNADLPTRDARGNLVQRPLVALNLHYLLSAYAAEELHAEILLGYAMQLFHENPILSREAVRTALAGGAVDPGVLPPAFQGTAASELADQVELIKITPETLSMDDLSKLWTALQTHYRTTVAYLVSVVLIESRSATRTPLPVLSRGTPDPSTGRDAGVAAQPSLVPPFPTLEAVRPPGGQAAVRMGETLTLSGHHLTGDTLLVRFVPGRSSQALDLPPLPDPSGTRIQVRIPPDPAPGPLPAGDPQNPVSWPAGAYGVRVVVRRAGDPDRESNELPVLLAPSIQVAAAPDGGAIRFDVTVQPPVHASQRTSLIVGQQQIPGPSLTGAPTASLSFRGEGFNSGTEQPVRLRVDGVDSLLIDRAARPPQFDPTQVVQIP